jgi:uncharacterized membrane protein YeaQ/YmgE (transglycosylase-associated protein family)
LLIIFLVGAVLAQKYKVMALLPAMALGIVGACCLTHISTVWQFVEVALITATTVQIGYASGLCIRYLMALIRQPRRTSALVGSRPPAPQRIAN